MQRLSKFVDDMKADIRTLHNDICERMLGKPPRGATAPAPRGSSSEWQRRTMELEEQLAGFRIAEDRVAEFGPQKLVEVCGNRVVAHNPVANTGRTECCGLCGFLLIHACAWL